MRFLLVILLSLWVLGAQAAVPTPSCTPSRTTGVAPLSVFLDCTATTDADTTTPFHDLFYEHNFGDPVKAKWAYGANTNASKNYATGPVAAHVYETAGTYTITTRVKDGTSTVMTTNTITVTDPDAYFSTTNTICIYNTTVGTGCPTGATQAASSSFSGSLTTYLGTGKRVLFKRGDTFTSGGYGVTVAGPGYVGAYGTGAKPIINNSGDVAVITMSSATTPTTVSDWRFVDLNIVGVTPGSSTFAFSYGGTFSRTTALRIDISNMWRGFRWEDSITQSNNTGANNGHTIHSENTIMDSTVTGSTSYDIFATGYKFAVMGNSISGGPWGTRWPQMVKALIEHNTISSTGTTTELIKLHAPTGCSRDTNESTRSYYITTCAYNADPFWPITSVWGQIWNDGVKTFGYSEKIVIADNKMTSAVGANYMATIGPQNGSDDERVRDVIFERNWLTSSANSQTILLLGSAYTVRNNVCNISAGTAVSCFNIGPWGVSLPPDYVWVYNNTVYAGNAATSELYFSYTNAAVTNLLIKNNLVYTTGTPATYALINVATGAGYAQSNNTTNPTVSPVFDGPTSAAYGFRPSAASYATTGGISLFPATANDFYGCYDKTATPQYRMGALVPKANALCSGGYK